MTREEMFDFALSHLEILQDRDECLWYLRRVDEYLGEVHNVLEIGTYKGGNTLMLSTTMRHGRIIGIDPNFPNIPVIEHMIFPNNFYHIKASSTDDSAWDAVGGILNGDKLDIAFIDGMHWYYFAENDFNRSLEFLASKSMVIVHNIGFGFIEPSAIQNKQDLTVGEWWVRKKWHCSYEEKRRNRGYSHYLGTGIMFIGE